MIMGLRSRAYGAYMGGMGGMRNRASSLFGPQQFGRKKAIMGLGAAAGAGGMIGRSSGARGLESRSSAPNPGQMY